MGSTHWKYSNEDIAAHLNFYILFSESDHSVVLKEINVPLWQHSVCNAALQSQFGPKYTLPKTAICAGAEGRDACDVRTSRGFFFYDMLFIFVGWWRRASCLWAGWSMVPGWNCQLRYWMWQTRSTRSLHQSAGFSTVAGADNIEQQKTATDFAVTFT